MGLQDMTEIQAVASFLTGLWAQLLGRPIGPYDDFFEIGGDSLTAVRMIVEVQKAYRVEVELESFFESPSIEKLAALIVNRQNTWSDHRSGAV